ncbi:hypothetical protein [uncultured Aquimarina sp.]|uniref:hypothetical protein n=1 Tax=uncultured Aquimarina sp. TaxID=575652 RepID=UPI00260E5FD8|nr:hypothetical protein [uncultured Aquimarina sp.]
MDTKQITTKKSTNYRTWSFRFLIYLLLLNILVAYMVATHVNLPITIEGYEKPENNTGTMLFILGGLTNLLFVAGAVLTVLSITKKEKRDYKYFVSIIGYPIFLVLGVASILLS